MSHILSLLAAVALMVTLGACDSVTDSTEALAVTPTANANPSGCDAPTVTTSTDSNGDIVVTASGTSIASWYVFSEGSTVSNLFDQRMKPATGSSTSFNTGDEAWVGTGTKSFRAYGVFAVCEGHRNISPVGSVSNVAYNSAGIPLDGPF